MSALDLHKRLQLTLYGLCMASSALDEVDDSADPEILEYRKALTSFMHHAAELCDKTSKRTKLTSVPRCQNDADNTQERASKTFQAIEIKAL